MINLPTWYDTGTVSVSGGGTTVTLAGGYWGDDAIMAGDLFCDPAQPLVPPQRVKEVTGDTTLELWAPWPGTTMAAKAYEIRYVGIIERSTAQSRRVLEQLGDVKAWADIFVQTDADRLALDTPTNPLAARQRVLVVDDGVIWQKKTSAYGDWLGPAEFKGDTGNKGWSPVHSVAVNGSRRVWQLVDWVGGEGSKPAGVGKYVGPSGLVDTMAAATDVRGPAGDISGVTAFWQARIAVDTTAAAARAGLGIVEPPQGRLSLTSGVAVPTADVASTSAIYYISCAGNLVPVWNGSAFVPTDIPADLALSLDADAGHTGYHAPNSNFDVYAFVQAGVLKLGTSPAWQSAILRGTGLAIENWKGLFVNAATLTLRFGAGAGDTVSVDPRKATLLGTFRAHAAGATRSTRRSRLLSNVHNPTMIDLFAGTATASYNYSSATLRLAEANANNKAEMVFALDGTLVRAINSAFVLSGNSSAWDKAVIAIGLDSDTAGASDAYDGWGATTAAGGNVQASPVCHYQGVPGIGFHTLSRLEQVSGTGTVTWYPYAAGARAHGLRGSYLG